MIEKSEYEFKNSKSTYGVKNINNRKFFFKKIKNIDTEIDGFNRVNKIYKIPKIIYCDENEILYEYKKCLKEKTIHEYLYNKTNLKINYKKIFDQYKKSIKLLVIKNESKYRNSDFFLKRVNTLKRYLTFPEFHQIHLFENKEYCLKEIIAETKEVIEKNKKIKGILTLGDPTDTNISTTGVFTDFECAGYNSVLGEIAIFFISLTTHGSYFYPKYNAGAYVQRTNILYDYSKNKQDIVYFDDANDRCILLPKFTILKKNKKVLLKFLKFYNKHFKNDIEIEKYLKYYICMRILTPLDVTKMDECDRKIIISWLIYLYENCTDIKSLINIVKKMKTKKIKRRQYE